MHLGTAVLAAQGDANQAEGRLRARYGGGAAEVRGARLMASGLPYAKWNGAVITAPDPDLSAARAWYARKQLPWGMRVPIAFDLTPGRYVLRQRCMGLLTRDFRPDSGSVEIRRAGTADVELVAAIDAVAFGGDAASAGDWMGPQLTDDGWQVYIAEVDREPAGVATGVYTDERAGPAVLVSGVGVCPAYRRRGVGAALSARVVADGFAAGARLAHLNPDTEAASRIYARLGFVEVPGFDIYEDGAD